MKKFFRSIALSTIAIAVIVGNAMAYQLTLDVSGERTQSRNATQGTTKAAYYNPAGLVNLPEGIHVDIGNRILYLHTSSEIPSGGEVLSTQLTTLLPNAAAVWRVGAGALFLTFDIREGGAGGYWDSANSIQIIGASKGKTINTNVVSTIEASTYTFGVTLGGAARLTNWLAISGGARYLRKSSYSYQEGPFVANGGTNEFADTYAYGWQGVAGVMITPMEGLNITFNYCSETMLTGEERDTYRNGTYSYTPYTSWSPNMIALGVGYMVAPGVEIQISYNFTMNGENYYGGTKKYNRDDEGEHVIGFGTEYKLMDMLTASFGISYHSEAGDPVNNNDPTDPAFDKWVLGIGVIVTPMQNLSIDLGMSYQIFQESEGHSATGTTQYTHNRDAYVFGFAVSYGMSM